MNELISALDAIMVMIKTVNHWSLNGTCLAERPIFSNYLSLVVQKLSEVKGKVLLMKLDKERLEIRLNRLEKELEGSKILIRLGFNREVKKKIELVKVIRNYSKLGLKEIYLLIGDIEKYESPQSLGMPMSVADVRKMLKELEEADPGVGPYVYPVSVLD